MDLKLAGHSNASRNILITKAVYFQKGILWNCMFLLAYVFYYILFLWPWIPLF